MVQIIHLPPRDPREQAVTDPDPLPGFNNDLAASVLMPAVAVALVDAHFALEGWGENRDPKRWSHPWYRRHAMAAIRACSEVNQAGALSAGEDYALHTFQALEERLASCDTDRETRRSLIREHFRNAYAVLRWKLEQGPIPCPLERAEYGQEGRIYEGEEDEAS